jgi:hypothetical protein
MIFHLSAQKQPKSQIMIHKHVSPRDLYITTLTLTERLLNIIDRKNGSSL